MPADHLDLLLIEDNPGDARLIEEMLGDVEELLERVDVGAPVEAGADLHHERRLETGMERLAELDVDVVLLDLGLPESTGLDTLATVVDATEFVPVVVLTGLRDEEVGLRAIQRGAQDYLVKEEVTSDLLVRSIHHAIERNRQERERSRQLEQLEALNRLNRISQDVTHAVITTSTREDLEQAVCERLVDGERYPFAWIGEVERSTERITFRAAAGAEEGYLEDATITVGDDATGQGPVGRAVRTRDVQVVGDVRTDPSFEPWRERALERGYRSVVAVPIFHESLLYGVLCLYAGSPEAFPEPATEILSRLGDVIGHAIAAIERKEALVEDTVLELEFELSGVADELVALTAGGEATVEFETFVPSDGTLVAYGHFEGVAPAEFRQAARSVDRVDDCRILESERGEPAFEIVGAAGSLFGAVAAHGGFVESAIVADGQCRFVVQFPPGRDKRRLVELVTEHCPGATPYAQRTIERRERDASDLPSVLQRQLTDKQRNALEVAYFAGYFEWPRTSTSQDIADRLGITPATFTHHLRAAERKFFDQVFEAAAAGDDQDAADWSPLESDSPTR